jgi:hypothetical protein
MRNAIILFFVVASCGVALAAPQTVLDSGDLESGGYGAPVMKVTSVAGSTGILVGGQGGWLINHTFGLGGAGYGLANASSIKVQNSAVDFGYGGLLLEYIYDSDSLVHPSASVLIGAGGVSTQGGNGPSNAVFVAEPQLSLNLNFTKFARPALHVSYRYVGAAGALGLSSANLSGFAAGISIAFGKF